MHGYELIYQGEDAPKGKVWRIVPTADRSGLRIEYGACDARPRSMTVPVSKCRHGDLFVEMERRVNNKLSEGYVVVRSDVAPMADSAEASRGDGQASYPKVLAYVGFSPLPASKRQSAEKRVKAHLLATLETACVPGSYSVTTTKDGFSVEGHFFVQAAPQSLFVAVGVGSVVLETQRTLGLLMASLASACPDLVSLADDEGNEISPRALGEAIRSEPRVLEQFGIVRLFKPGKAQPLGEWFF